MTLRPPRGTLRERIADHRVHNTVPVILGTSATHAIRALAHLAARGPSAVVPRSELAGSVGVPGPYLAKIMSKLVRAGVASATRGVGGGYRLRRDPADVALGEVVEPFEGRDARPGCLLRPGQPCSEDGTCTAHLAWGAVHAAYAGFLEGTTLADIQGRIEPRRRAAAARKIRNRSSHRRRIR